MSVYIYMHTHTPHTQFYANNARKFMDPPDINLKTARFECIKILIYFHLEGK